MTDQHLTTRQLAGYLEGTLAREEAAASEAHLAACAACRGDLVAGGRALTPAARPWRAPLLATLGTAAALALLLPLVRRPASAPGDVRERGALEAPLRVMAPAEDARVATATLHFAWQAADSGAQYHVTVTDSVGRPVWQADSGDTLVTPTVALGTQGVHYWFVDALLPDGRTRTSGTHRFILAP